MHIDRGTHNASQLDVMDSHAFHTLVGTSAPAAAVLISFSEVEAWLRILSLLMGICIGAVSLYKMLKAKKP